MDTWFLFQCRICGRYAIAEELSLHKCRKLLDISFDGDLSLIFDVYYWHLLKNAKPTGLLLGEDSVFQVSITLQNHDHKQRKKLIQTIEKEFRPNAADLVNSGDLQHKSQNMDLPI